MLEFTSNAGFIKCNAKVVENIVMEKFMNHN